jgi:hypothetical protein
MRPTATGGGAGRTGRRRDRGRQARAALLWGLGLFALSQVALRAYVEHRRPELRDPAFETKYRQLGKLLAGRGPRAGRVVFLGSSLTAHGIRAGLLDEPLTRALGRPAAAFNLGIFLSGPFSQLVYVRRLLDRGVRPDLVVVEASPLLQDCPYCRADVYLFPGQRVERRELRLVERHGGGPGLRPAWWQSFLVPAYGHRQAVLTCCARGLLPYADRLPTWEDMDDHGWIPREVDDPERHRAALAAMRAALGPQLGRFQARPGPLRALTELLALLHRQHVPAVLVVMPEGPLFRSLYRPGSDTALLQRFAALARQYHTPLVNARSWLTEEQFVDSHHANRLGAAVLTERLGREALVPLLARRPVTRTGSAPARRPAASSAGPGAGRPSASPAGRAACG